MCIPVSLQETFNPRHVTHIVWAKSGLEDKSKDMWDLNDDEEIVSF